MKARTILLGLMLLPLSLAVPAQAQTPKPATTTHPQSAADAAARKQLAAYLTEYRNDPTNADLRDEIIELAKTLKPAPLVPQAARTEFAKAMAQLKAAATSGDDKAAAAAFEQVAAQAPWWADAYLNAASAYAKAGDLSNAKLNLALYNSAVRPGVSTAAADDLQSEIDRQQAEMDRQQAEIARQKAEAERQQSVQRFQQTVQDFQKNPSDSGREQIIKLALTMNPAPAVPDDAMHHMARAKAAFEDAKNVSGFKGAIEEFKNASLAAPWFGDIYYNLGVAQDKASEYGDAIQSLNFYLEASPGAPDTPKVKELIDEVGYRKEKADLGKKLLNMASCGTLDCAPGPGQTPDWNVVRSLLNQGANVQITNQDGRNALVYALGGNAPDDIVKLMIDKGADVNAGAQRGPYCGQCGSGGEVLTAAATRWGPEIVHLLLDKGAGVNAKDYTGDTPLMEAAEFNCFHPDVVRLLLDKGADFNARDLKGKTALKHAEESLECPFCSEENRAQCARGLDEIKRILRDAGGTE